MRSVPAVYSSTDGANKRLRGRPVAANMEDSFKYAIAYLEENYDEQIAVTDLVGKMRERCEYTVYSTQHMKQRILEYFSDNVIITELHGKPNVVTLHHTATSILPGFYKQQEDIDTESKMMNIIKTAGMLIKNDIQLKSVEINHVSIKNVCVENV
ncbi:hypothetical protein ACF0H5_004150 [Mactra antiquata]